MYIVAHVISPDLLALSKRSFGVLKLPIVTEFDLFGPKFHFSLDILHLIFCVQFSAASGTPISSLAKTSWGLIQIETEFWKKKLKKAKMSYLEQMKKHFQTHSKVKDYCFHQAKVHSVDWNADGRKLASGSFDKTVTIFTLDRDRLVSSSIIVQWQMLASCWLSFTRTAWHLSPSYRLLHRVLMYSWRSTTLSLLKKLFSSTANFTGGNRAKLPSSRWRRRGRSLREVFACSRLFATTDFSQICYRVARGHCTPCTKTADSYHF